MNFPTALRQFADASATHKSVVECADELDRALRDSGMRTPVRRDPMFDPRAGDVLLDGEEAVHAIVAVTAESVWFYAQTEGGIPGLFCWPRADWIAHVTDNDPEAPAWVVFGCHEECVANERAKAKNLAALDAKLAARDAEGKS